MNKEINKFTKQYKLEHDKEKKVRQKKFPYWKILFYSEISITWKDHQKAFDDPNEAKEYAKTLHYKRMKLIEVVSNKERKLLEEIEK